VYGRCKLVGQASSCVLLLLLLLAGGVDVLCCMLVVGVPGLQAVSATITTSSANSGLIGLI
jgi:hypothetical protein